MRDDTKGNAEMIRLWKRSFLQSRVEHERQAAKAAACEQPPKKRKPHYAVYNHLSFIRAFAKANEIVEEWRNDKKKSVIDLVEDVAVALLLAEKFPIDEMNQALEATHTEDCSETVGDVLARYQEKP